LIYIKLLLFDLSVKIEYIIIIFLNSFLLIDLLII